MRRKSLKKFLVLLLTTSMVGTMYVPAMATEVRPSDTTVESTDEQNVTDDQGTVENDQENQVSVQSDEATGTEENTGEGVAQIGEKTYATLQEAVDASEAGATIQLLADVTEDVTITEGKNLTLDLNGRTLKNTGAGKATVLVDANAQVTVKNGTVLGGASYYNIRLEKTGTAVLEDVVATAGNNGSSMIDNYGTLTIESGTYTGGLNVVKNEPTGDVTINGGTFEMTSVGSLKGFTGVIFTYGKLVINDGTFKQSVKSVRYGYLQTVFIDADSTAQSNPITYINGGNFTNATTSSTAWNVRASNKATSAGKIAISGGTFNKNFGVASKSYIADGYMSVYSAKKYTVKKVVAQIGTTNYADLATALAKGGNVKLLSDITTDATKTAAADRLYVKKDCTLDLNGYSITFPYELEPTDNFAGFFVNGATMTVKDTSKEQIGKIQTGDQDNMGVYLFNVMGGGTLILESGNYFGGGTVAQAQKGNVYVKGGNYAVKAFGDPYDSQFLLNCYDPAYKNGTATITVTGGTFENFDPANCTAESTGTSFVAAGYESTGNNGTYTVAKKSDAEEALTADTKVTGTASNATIGGNYTGKEKDIETKDGNVTINISNGDKNVIASNIFVSNESIKSLNDNSSVENVAIKSDVADMTINKDALTAINTAAAGEDVMFKIEKESTDEQLLYHVTAVAGGKDVYTASTSAANGNVSISVPYVLNTEGMTPIVYYVPASGAKQVVESTYVEGTLTWKTSHFSTFEIGEAFAAEDSVAQITATDGTITRYATLQNAVDAAEDGQTVTALTDISQETTVLNVSEKENVVLDLNGYTIASTKASTIRVSGKLVVKDSTATNPTVKDAVVSGYQGGKVSSPTIAISVFNGGNLTLESGKVESTSNYAIRSQGNVWKQNEDDINSVVTIKNGYVIGREGGVGAIGRGAIVNIDGGVIEATDNAAVAGNGTNDDTYYFGGTTINITGGNIVGHIISAGYIACGIYHPQDGVLNISGETIYADGGVGVLMRGGTMNMTGGDIVATGTASGKVGDANVIANSYGIYVDGSANYYGAKQDNFVTNISGGSVVASSGVPALNLSNTTDGTTKGSISVSKGKDGTAPTFSSAIDESYCADSDTSSEGYLPVEIKDADDNVVYSVDNSVQANFWGAQLRMDSYKNADGTTDYTQTDLRLGYEYQINPEFTEDVNVTEWGWNYSIGNDKLGKSIKGVNKRNNFDNLGKKYENVTNLLFTGIPTDGYNTDVYSQMYITYEKGGKTYTAKTGVDHRSVSEIANKILSNDGADPDQKTYADGLMKALSE